MFPDRVDCSVNSAHVEETYSSAPILHAQPAGNVAGAFNGGGLGNKCILAFRVGDLLPLGLFTGFKYTWRDLNPGTPGIGVYANLVLDVNGDGSAYKIASIDPISPPALGNGTTITNPDGTKTTSFNGATDNLLIVNGLLNPPLPPGGPGFVPPTVPGAPLPGGWPSNSYSLASILAAYPACRLAEASSLDNGLPKAPNKTPAFMIITGDSINMLVRAFRLTNIEFNGVKIS